VTVNHSSLHFSAAAQGENGATPQRAPRPAGLAPAGHPGAGYVPVVVLSGRAEVAELVHSVAGPGTRIGMHRWADGESPVDPEQLVAELAAADTGVVCIGDDVPLHLAFGLASLIDRAHAQMNVVLLAAPWPEVWRDALRAGVRDVVDPHAGASELQPALARAVERAAQLRSLRASVPATAPPRARVIVVLSPKGGSGKTMVASNLTAALAGAAEGPVALVDLDVQFGDSASALGLVPEHTVGQLALTPDIDSTTLKVFLTPHEPSGAFVLCGAESPDEGEAVTDQQAVRVVELLEQDFACVVVDTPAGLDERTLAVLDRATDVVFVSTLDVSSIRNLGKEIQALDRLGMATPSRHFVLNRADARVGIEPSDVEAALGIAVDAAVPSSRVVPLSMNQGRPVVLDDPSSPSARELAKLAQRFLPGDAAHAGASHGEAEPGAWFRRLRR
jgi:pilus assembly protein CpaE